MFKIRAEITSVEEQEIELGDSSDWKMASAMVNMHLLFYKMHTMKAIIELLQMLSTELLRISIR